MSLTAAEREALVVMTANSLRGALLFGPDDEDLARACSMLDPDTRSRLLTALAGGRSPWIPADPDGLPPRTYPAWRAQEAARRGLEAT